MYEKRIKIFVVLSIIPVTLCLVRLIQMQLLSHSYYRTKIAELKLKGGQYRQLKTVRGKILDRKGRILAVDDLRFQLDISYKLSSLLDERVKEAKLLKATRENKPARLSRIRKEIETSLEDLQQIIDKCSCLGVSRAEIEDKIRKINNMVWDLRTFQAWRKNCSKSKLFNKYKDKLFSVKRSEFVIDFEKQFANRDDRLILISQTDIKEMHKTFPLLELKSDDDVFTAQLEFLEFEGLCILPKAHRFYPFGSVASQTIGWVGPAQQRDKRLFADDNLSSYMADEVCGREDGVEYVCETVLRGRRGELIHDIDRKLVGRTKTKFGQDVSITLDIELQKRIEEYLTDPQLNSDYYNTPIAAVVIDVESCEILALVSTPTFDLNSIRRKYSDFANDPNEPLRNRAINKQYPPGSAVKPIILIAGLETGKITAEEIISCPAKSAGRQWPNCWIYNRFRIGHDDKWTYQDNNARNAIKGSCNIYFSQLANRIEPLMLQKWLWNFGCGFKILAPPATVRQSRLNRKLRQVQGQISNVFVTSPISDFNDIPPLKKNERRWFGIGQGNLRLSPLQAANAMAVIARGGVFKKPRLFIEDSDDDVRGPSVNPVVSSHTLAVVKEGMKAVVSEPGGTAYKEFSHSGLDEQGITVYGKTGSTEKPSNAWFAGFAEGEKGEAISIAVIVEGGQHGSSDAAPRARDIIQFCIDAGYLARNN